MQKLRRSFPYPTLPYPTLPYPTLPYLTLPYPSLHIFFVSSSPLPFFSGSSVISLLRLFLLYRLFLPFLLLSFLASSSSTPPPLFLFLFSFSLGFVPLSVISCSFFRLLFCLLLPSRALRSSLSFLSASLFFFFACFYVFPVCQSFSFLLASPFLSPLPLLFFGSLYSSAVPLSSAGGSLSLVSPCSPSSPTPCLCLLPLRPSSFFCSGLPPLPFFVFLSIPSILMLFCLSFFLILVSSPSLVPLILGCLSFSFTFVCSILFGCSSLVVCAPERGGGSPVLFVFCVSRGGTPRFGSSTLQGVCSLFFILLSVFLCHSFFTLY